MMSYQDTIFALSSGGLPSGVAVIRVSGRHSGDAVMTLCGSLPSPRQAKLMDIFDQSCEKLDSGLVLFFEGPASFTGEDCAEFQVHGGKAVVKAILDALSQIEGLRHATAGEFSRRAFENGKLDLVEVEGLAGLIQAETEMQRKVARYISEGHLSDRYRDWMKRLSYGRAMIEAELDFADESDVPGSVSDQVWKDVSKIKSEMESAAANKAGEIVRDGFRIAIAGAPNAGKSSLMNYLVQRDVAIVSDIAGTTRDVIHVDLDLDGYKVSLFDTAGIRETEDAVEKIGVERALHVVSSADAVLNLFESANEASALAGVSESDVPWIRVLTKLDKLDSVPENCDIAISTVSGEGIDSLMKRIQELLASQVDADGLNTPLLSRHRNNIARAVNFLDEAIREVGLPLEIRAEFLRSATDELGKIVGTVSADELLGHIFSEFCIGK